MNIASIALIRAWKLQNQTNKKSFYVIDFLWKAQLLTLCDMRKLFHRCSLFFNAFKRFSFNYFSLLLCCHLLRRFPRLSRKEKNLTHLILFFTVTTHVIQSRPSSNDSSTRIMLWLVSLRSKRRPTLLNHRFSNNFLPLASNQWKTLRNVAMFWGDSVERFEEKWMKPPLPTLTSLCFANACVLHTNTQMLEVLIHSGGWNWRWKCDRCRMVVKVGGWLREDHTLVAKIIKKQQCDSDYYDFQTHDLNP